ncbi:MAG: VCBS repeat-containing protein [Candidatus Acidiferrales bacterium]
MPLVCLQDVSENTARKFASAALVGCMAGCIAMFPSCSKTAATPSIDFAAPVAYTTGGTTPVWAAAADFNGDGKMDLAVANQGSFNVAILFGNGDGTFQTPVTYPVNSNGSHPVALEVGDFDGDGKPDIVVVNASSGASVPSIAILLNKGDGTFGAPILTTTPANGQSITTGDLNSDGNVDIWVGAPGQSFLMLGNGDGTFGAPVPYMTSPTGTGGGLGVAIGDVNNDGKPDLTASNYLPSNVGVLLNGGNNEFSDLYTVPVQNSPAGMALVDFDHDGNLDMVVTNFLTNTATIRFGAGDGTFQKHTFAYAGSGPVAVAVADFDRSGNYSLAFADYNGDGVEYVAGGPGGSVVDNYDFPTGSSKYIAPQVSSVVAADFNGDGRPDIAAVNSAENTIAILINQKPQ